MDRVAPKPKTDDKSKSDDKKGPWKNPDEKAKALIEENETKLKEYLSYPHSDSKFHLIDTVQENLCKYARNTEEKLKYLGARSDHLRSALRDFGNNPSIVGKAKLKLNLVEVQISSLRQIAKQEALRNADAVARGIPLAGETKGYELIKSKGTLRSRSLVQRDIDFLNMLKGRIKSVLAKPDDIFLFKNDSDEFALKDKLPIIEYTESALEEVKYLLKILMEEEIGHYSLSIEDSVLAKNNQDSIIKLMEKDKHSGLSPDEKMRLETYMEMNNFYGFCNEPSKIKVRKYKPLIQQIEEKMAKVSDNRKRLQAQNEDYKRELNDAQPSRKKYLLEQIQANNKDILRLNESTDPIKVSKRDRLRAQNDAYFLEITDAIPSRKDILKDLIRANEEKIDKINEKGVSYDSFLSEEVLSAIDRVKMLSKAVNDATDKGNKKRAEPGRMRKEALKAPTPMRMPGQDKWTGTGHSSLELKKDSVIHEGKRGAPHQYDSASGKKRKTGPEIIESVENRQIEAFDQYLAEVGQKDGFLWYLKLEYKDTFLKIDETVHIPKLRSRKCNATLFIKASDKGRMKEAELRLWDRNEGYKWVNSINYIGDEGHVWMYDTWIKNKNSRTNRKKLFEYFKLMNDTGETQVTGSNVFNVEANLDFEYDKDEGVSLTFKTIPDETNYQMFFIPAPFTYLWPMNMSETFSWLSRNKTQYQNWFEAKPMNKSSFLGKCINFALVGMKAAHGMVETQLKKENNSLSQAVKILRSKNIYPSGEIDSEMNDDLGKHAVASNAKTKISSSDFHTYIPLPKEDGDMVALAEGSAPASSSARDVHSSSLASLGTSVREVVPSLDASVREVGWGSSASASLADMRMVPPHEMVQQSHASGQL